MNLRDFVNNNAAGATIVAAVLLLFALGVIVWQNKGPTPREFQAFYYDLNTRSLFVESGVRTTPFERGSGTFEYPDGKKGSAVRAIIWTCNDPAEIEAGMTLAQIQAAGGFVAYLERMTPQMIARQTKIDTGQILTEDDYAVDYDDTLISTIDGQAWFTPRSDQGRQLISDMASRCGPNQRPRACLP